MENLRFPGEIHLSAQDIVKALNKTPNSSNNEGYYYLLDQVRGSLEKFFGSMTDHFTTPLDQASYDETDLQDLMRELRKRISKGSGIISEEDIVMAEFKLLGFPDNDYVDFKEFQPEVVGKVLELSKKGLNKTEDSIGYHGTSHESLVYLFKFGHLPGATFVEESPHMGEKQPVLGDLYFAPRFPDPGRDKHQLSCVSVYARDRASEHFLCHYFGRKISDNNPPTRQELRVQYGLTTYRQDVLLRRSKLRKGVVFSLSKEIADKYQLRRGDDDNVEDLRINCPDGLPVGFINGIQAQGLEEVEFLDKLTK